MPITLSELNLPVGAATSQLEEPEADFLFDDGEAPGRVLGLECTETLSTVYDLRVEILVEDPYTEASQWAGRRASVQLSRGESGRGFCGLVRRVEQLQNTMDQRTLVRLHLVPELWLLSLRSDNRVFHHLNAVEIVREVLKSAGIYGGSRTQLRLGVEAGAQCLPRDYCVQFGESDLDFVQRLLEEEGLTYYFLQEGSQETLVLTDGALASSGIAFSDARVAPHRGRNAIYMDPQRKALAAQEGVTRLEAYSEVTSDGVVLSDFDFTNFLKRDAVRVDRPRGRNDARLVQYEHPGRFVHVDHEDELTRAAMPSLRSVTGASAAPQYDEHSGVRFADVRLEEFRSTARTLRGDSSITALMAGVVLSVEEHVNPTLDGVYLTTQVTHRFRAENEVIEGDRKATDRYSNSFVCMPRGTVFRPQRRTPRPRIHGVQTATVVGGPGDELHTDYYGRVKVQFHWDRQSACYENDHHSFSAHTHVGDAIDPKRHCWVRVSQGWAGRGWGSMFIPRVGMEVVVTFENGDPDRPLIVGCVYNDANPPPYELPAHATRSTIRSRSTPHQGHDPGFNEFRFEDAAGREEVYLHAQRDLNEYVRKDHTTTVDGEQRIAVLENQSSVVTGSQSNAVAGNRTHSVGGSETLTVNQDQRQYVLGNREEMVNLNETITVRGNRTVYVEGSMTEHLKAPVVTTVTRPVPDGKSNSDEEEEHKREVADDGSDTNGIEYAQSHTVNGHRLTQIQGIDQHFLEARRVRVDNNDRSYIGGEHLINAQTANLLVGDTTDPESLVTGYYFDSKKIRVGTTLEDLGDMRVFRGKDRLYFQKDKVLLEASDKELTISIAGSECSIKLSSDGKKIEIRASETVELKGEKASITIGKEVVLNGGGGGIKMQS